MTVWPSLQHASTLLAMRIAVAQLPPRESRVAMIRRRAFDPMKTLRRAA